MVKPIIVGFRNFPIYIYKERGEREREREKGKIVYYKIVEWEKDVGSTSIYWQDS